MTGMQAMAGQSEPKSPDLPLQGLQDGLKALL
jgi:hypothetical protein